MKIPRRQETIEILYHLRTHIFTSFTQALGTAFQQTLGCPVALSHLQGLNLPWASTRLQQLLRLAAQCFEVLCCFRYLRFVFRFPSLSHLKPKGSCGLLETPRCNLSSHVPCDSCGSPADSAWRPNMTDGRHVCSNNRWGAAPQLNQLSYNAAICPSFTSSSFGYLRMFSEA